MWTVLLKTFSPVLETKIINDYYGAKEAYAAAIKLYGDRVLCVVQGKHEETVYPAKKHKSLL